MSRKVLADLSFSPQSERPIATIAISTHFPPRDEAIDYTWVYFVEISTKKVHNVRQQSTFACTLLLQTW